MTVHVIKFTPISKSRDGSVIYGFLDTDSIKTKATELVSRLRKAYPEGHNLAHLSSRTDYLNFFGDEVDLNLLLSHHDITRLEDSNFIVIHGDGELFYDPVPDGVYSDMVLMGGFRMEVNLAGSIYFELTPRCCEPIAADTILRLEDLQPINGGHYTAKPSICGAIYCTTFCNHGHYVDTGEPVDHECITIPPEALAAEMNGDFEGAISLMKGNS